MVGVSSITMLHCLCSSGLRHMMRRTRCHFVVVSRMHQLLGSQEASLKSGDVDMLKDEAGSNE